MNLDTFFSIYNSHFINIELPFALYSIAICTFDDKYLIFIESLFA